MPASPNPSARPRTGTRPGAIKHEATACTLCGLAKEVYLFSRHGARVLQCTNCGLTRLDGQPDTGWTPAAGQSTGPRASITERRAADAYVASLVDRGASRSGLLVVASPGHPFAGAAASAGFTIGRQLDATALDEGPIPGGPYECGVVLFQLEQTTNPVRALERIHRALVPGAVLLVVTPSLDSWSARTLGSQWTEWRPANGFYFDRSTIQSACLRTGFAELELAADRRLYTIDHLRWRAATSPPTLITGAVHAGASLVPRGWRERLRVTLPSSGLVVTARRTEPAARPRLSVIMPVFNERATFERTIEAVLGKACDGVDKEVVIVESRSTDGTRELVRRYEGRPGITVVFEERPRGKGHAVRTGLARATGTLVLIQDADSEYDVNDYDALLEPLLTYQRAFVLGSRHVGSWKVRTFNNQPGITAFFNFGHLLFGTALNVLFRQRIKDPFTMYKVFRRDCLHGVRLECNRFDFDFELVIKLVRKGYTPLEVPVNYVARSFQQGKKVSAFRDPVTWIRALVKYRFASIYEKPRR